MTELIQLSISNSSGTLDDMQYGSMLGLILQMFEAGDVTLQQVKNGGTINLTFHEVGETPGDGPVRELYASDFGDAYEYNNYSPQSDIAPKIGALEFTGVEYLVDDTVNVNSYIAVTRQDALDLFIAEFSTINSSSVTINGQPVTVNYEIA